MQNLILVNDTGIAARLCLREALPVRARRTEHSWHGIRALACPPDRRRKIFIVVINRLTPQVRLRHLRGKDADGYSQIGSGT